MTAARMSFSYPDDMKDKLTELAKQDCRSLSSYIQKVLLAHLENNPIEVPKKKKSHPKSRNQK
jgi:predicted DNA-binding protein